MSVGGGGAGIRPRIRPWRVKIAVHILNHMLTFECPGYVRVG
jgi:hypothetical protein